VAVALYYQWDSLGRPLEPARPIRDIVERMKVAYPRAASTFSWYANESHYTAEPPQDHTPFSATGWPQVSPQWWVFATDIMHRPDLGVDCNVLFNYWIAEARAGRMPWLKYMIWQAKLYDVRNGWRPQANSGHFDHIHLSVRTDFKDRGLGSWSIVPGGADMDVNQNAKLDAVFNAWDTVKLDTNNDGTADQTFPVPLTALLKAMDAKLTDPVPVEVDAEAVAAALAADTAFLAALAKAVNDDAAARLAD
jgi:hypothetical protein